MRNVLIAGRKIIMLRIVIAPSQIKKSQNSQQRKPNMFSERKIKTKLLPSDWLIMTTPTLNLTYPVKPSSPVLHRTENPEYDILTLVLWDISAIAMKDSQTFNQIYTNLLLSTRILSDQIRLELSHFSSKTVQNWLFLTLPILQSVTLTSSS